MKTFIILLCFFYSTYSVAEIAVVAHPSNTNSVSADDIKRMFLGKKKSFPDGSKATVFYVDGSDPIRETFNKKALGKSSSQLKSYWAKLVFTGKGVPPEDLNADDVISSVANDDSAIGYVDSSKVDDRVKVLFTL